MNSSILEEDLCRKEPTKQHYYFSDPMMKGLFINWSGKIDTSDIYNFYILNCADNNPLYTVKMEFINNNTYLDSRYTKHATVYGVSSIIHLLLSIIWLFVEIISYTKEIKMTFYISGLPCLRSLYLLFASYDWYFQAISDRRYINIHIAGKAIEWINYVFLVSSMLISFSGYLSTRPNMTYREKLEIFSNSFIFITFAIFIDMIDNAMIRYICIIFSISSFAWLISYVFTYLSTYCTLLESQETEETQKIRIQYVISLITMCVDSTILVLFVSLVAHLIFQDKCYAIICFEPLMIFFEFIIIYYNHQVDKYQIKTEDTEKVSPIVIIEPRTTSIILVKQHENV